MELHHLTPSVKLSLREPLVVIHNLDVRRSGRFVWPLKTDPPLVVNPNAVLAFAVAFQGLETVARQRR